jgi:type IV pilus assembly protein PilO
MALFPSKQRDQIMVVVCVLAVAAATLYWYYPWSRKHEELVVVQAHVDSLDAINRQVKSQVAQGTVARIKAQAETYSMDLEAMRHLVPTGNEVPALLDQISSAARRAGLDISDVTPEGVTPGDQFDTYKYKIGVTGPYHQVAAFLSNIGSLQRIVAPMNLALDPSAQPARRKTEALLDAKFEVQTYVAHVSTPIGSLAPVGEP